jgi:hypothetical protein
MQTNVFFRRMLQHAVLVQEFIYKSVNEAHYNFTFS